jgi:hypothetical protein
MDTRIWTDNCPRCSRTCGPASTAIDGEGRVDSYQCACGREWATARMVEVYEGFAFPIPAGSVR